MIIATAILFLSPMFQAETTQTAGAGVNLQRTYKVGDETNYMLTISSDASAMKFDVKLHVKTLKLIDGGKASQELSITEAPAGGPKPENVTWTFGKDGLPEADFNTTGGSVTYSILSFLSVVPGAITPGKEFKVSWTSPDKKSTVTGTGTYQGIKDLKGAKVAVIKTTLTVKPGEGGDGTIKNTASFDPTTGKLIAAEGTIEANGQPAKFTVTSG